MRLGILGDCHFTNQPPERRLDDFWAVQKQKFIRAIQAFKDNGCDHTIQTGDLFNTPGVSNVVVSEIIEILRSHDVVLHVVFGNHDIWGHAASTIPSSPLAVLQAAGVIRILGKRWRCGVEEGSTMVLPISIYGAGFGEDIPVPVHDPTESYNILVTHAPVGDVQAGANFPLIHPRQFLKHHSKYNLIICGHYHFRFSDHLEYRWIINPGVLVRRTISQQDAGHVPSVMIFDTNDPRANAVVALGAEPFEKVFDLSVTKKLDNEAINQFVNDIRERRTAQNCVSWKQILLDVMKAKSTSNGASEIIGKYMENTHVK